jgi:hypothetical protein
LNWRSAPCGEILGAPKQWTATGVITEEPVTRACFDNNYEWFKIQWSDGSEGWSISNNLKISQPEKKK